MYWKQPERPNKIAHSTYPVAPSSCADRQQEACRSSREQHLRARGQSGQLAVTGGLVSRLSCQHGECVGISSITTRRGSSCSSCLGEKPGCLTRIPRLSIRAAVLCSVSDMAFLPGTLLFLMIPVTCAGLASRCDRTYAITNPSRAARGDAGEGITSRKQKKQRKAPLLSAVSNTPPHLILCHCITHLFSSRGMLAWLLLFGLWWGLRNIAFIRQIWRLENHTTHIDFGAFSAILGCHIRIRAL